MEENELNPKEKNQRLAHDSAFICSLHVFVGEFEIQSAERILSAKGCNSVGLMEEWEAKCCGNLHSCPARVESEMKEPIFTRQIALL